ncbi:MAG: hypothetical protein JWO05_3658 [Gemmatimonadetes bacterium]|nr:hypothetical protein [Gemmatimonadota bacterium]
MAVETFRTTPPLPTTEDDPADSLYRTAREALNARNYRRAADLFGDIPRRFPKSTYTADSYYWRAFALYRAGSEDDLRDAVASLEEQRSAHADAGTRADADALMIRIRGALGKKGDQESGKKVASAALEGARCSKDDDEDDVRTAALNALMQMDASRAMPILKQVMARRDACSASLRRKGIFLLSQVNTKESDAMIVDAITADPSQEVREQAVFWMGQRRSPENAAFLKNLFRSSKSEELQKNVLFSLSQMGGMGNDKWLLEVANDTSVPMEVRKHALFCASQAGTRSTDFAAMYDRMKEPELKEQLIWLVSESNSTAAADKLIDIAKNDPNREMRKKAIFWLGQKNDPRIQQLLLDIINKR